ncbi:hypothetical protein Bhyg_14106 [Pseudolycoriella hygida]|uniref:Uncharacterized protein n=1 Tax=Pseudolycoriella hygida TaxID=35572 RepID=A0A9Q0MQW9_9DIPT|nr:hypothetical protein Bhyg_14106 [Pseudolycoriella hygida]
MELFAKSRSSLQPGIMFAKYFSTVSLIYLLVSSSSGTPAKYARSYTPQTFVPANDINDLEEDHVKRALSDVTATIKEVQKLLETDPNLPRLTRGEIEELFENVTKEEYEKSLQKGDRDRAKHMRALMLVLPYNTNNNSDLQELYTRPPITRVINQETKTQKLQKIVVQPEDVDPSSPGKSATTYKPMLEIRSSTPRATTFHPKSEKVATLTGPIVMTTTTTSTPAPSVVSHLPNYIADRPPAPFKAQPQIRENVKDLLATIGLTQELVPTTTPKPEMTQELKDLLQSFGLLTNEEPPKHVGPIEPVYRNVESIQEQFEAIPSSLTRDESVFVDEFKPLPSRLPAQVRSNYRMNIGPEVTPYDYQSFKPLPIPEDVPINGDMEEFLRSFGLFDGNARGKKSMFMENEENPFYPSEILTATERPAYLKMDKMPEVSVDFLAPDLIGVLENIGVTTVKKSGEKSHDRGYVVYNENVSENNIRRSSENIHDEDQTVGIANGRSENVAMKMKKKQNITDEDFNKLKQLLETIKKLDKLNANLTDKEIESLNLNNFNLSESLLAQGPNILDNVEFDETKNEIKRQSEETTDSPNPLRFTLDLQATTEEYNEKGDFLNLTTASTTPTSTTIEEIKTSTSTEEPRRNGLEESFGSLDPVTEEPLPAPRRNGFYFLADWNSFLEVGEDPDKVIVRFDPKVGDPSRFLPVTVP